MSDSYNLLIESMELTTNDIPSFYRTYTIPSVQFSHGSRLLFGNGPRWYNSIYYSFKSDLKVIQRDGNILYNDIQKDTISYQNGVNHRFSLSSSQKIFKYINDDEDCIFERQPLQNLSADGELMAFKHEGFWHPMDTLRDKRILNDLLKKRKAPWLT